LATSKNRNQAVSFLAAVSGLLLSAVWLTCSVSAAQVSVSGATQSTPPSRPSMINPKARELLDKCVRAMGGDAFLRFRTLTTRGRTFAISDEQTSGLAPFESVVVFPDKRRFSYGKSKPVVLINDGDKQWEVDSYGVTSQTLEQVRRWKFTNYYGIENLLRLRIREPGFLAQDGGVDFVNNLPARVLDMVDSQQVQIKLFLDRNTFLPLQISYTVPNPKAEEQDEFADVYGDYRQVQGAQTPMHISRFLNGERVGEIFRNSAQYDQSYPPDYFQPGR
jgi:hypothetical protein